MKKIKLPKFKNEAEERNFWLKLKLEKNFEQSDFEKVSFPNMKHTKELAIIPKERIVSRIFLIRGKKVMLDSDLAELYGVETKSLNRAVKRNIERFPADFMFQLNDHEAEIWKSKIVTSDLRYQFGTLSPRLQIVTLKKGHGQHRKYLPYVFTEQGVTMLSSVLNSKRAIQVSIQVVRTFIQLRELLSTNKEMREKIESIERKYVKHDNELKEIFEVLKRLLVHKEKPKRKIGF